MNRFIVHYRKVFIAAALLLLPGLAQAQLASLSITVVGLEPADGTVEVSVFDSEENYLQTPLVQQSLAVEGKAELNFLFAGLLEGDYAVVVVHDANDNGMLDTGFLGFGGENYAFSNNASALLGRPSFDSARITVGTEDLDITIDLN